MDDEAIWTATAQQRRAAAELLARLTPDQWGAPSLCTGWTVRDVAAHLSIGPRTSVGRALVEILKAGGSFNRMVHRTAVRRAARLTDAQIVAELVEVAGSRRLAPGQSVREPLLDIIIHSQDIALPLGIDHPIVPEQARESAIRLWGMRRVFHPQRDLAGTTLIADDIDWRVGSGPQVTGPIGALLLLLAGRTALVHQLHGPGLTRLRERIGLSRSRGNPV